MSSNPYSAPIHAGKGTAPAQSVHPMQPLYEASGWMSFLGWLMIIYGILQCLSIIGVIVGWLPIWIGIVLKGSADRLKSGFVSGDTAQLYDSSRQLATYFTIMGVLALIGLLLTALVITIYIVMFIALAAGALR